MLGGAAAMVALLFSLNRAGVTRLLPYLLTGGTVVFHASVRRAATVAGILLAFFIPLRTRNAADEVPLDRLEHAINPWVTFMILPLFGFANAGVALSGMTR
ncbi:Na+/H+ antiporter NhaA [Klebsiella pneumoniae subsp. pneumoniae]|nr:Na+/H+ antiporter NhaA [Klebsiella pneumoniae subsp. pneumoniae]